MAMHGALVAMHGALLEAGGCTGGNAWCTDLSAWCFQVLTDPKKAIAWIGHHSRRSVRVGDQIMQAGGVDALMGAAWRGGLKEREGVAWALGGLAGGSEANRDAIREAGGIEWLVSGTVYFVALPLV